MNRIFLVLISALALSATTASSQSKEELQARIDRLEGELSRARAEIARLTPDARKARELPLKLGQRKAVLGSGNVLQIQSTSTKTLPLRITLISPTFRKTNTFEVVLDAATVLPSKKEIGHAEGWSVAPGDWLQIESKGYDMLREKFE